MASLTIEGVTETRGPADVIPANVVEMLGSDTIVRPRVADPTIVLRNSRARQIKCARSVPRGRRPIVTF